MFENQLVIDFVLAMIDDLRRLMASYEHWWHHYATLHHDSMVITCKIWSPIVRKLVVGPV